jgi:isoquinoline 1-oxidoreductase beta subunit
MPGVIDVVQIADGVAVVADTYWHAYNARKKGLTVKFEDGAVGGMSSAGMWAAIKSAEKDIKAIKIRPDVGDAAGAIAGATKVVKANYTTAMMAHQPLEPMNMIADVKGDKCDLTGPTQFQQGAQGTAAAVLGIKPENVTVRTTYLGGGFGRRIELDFISQAVQVSKAVGRPVKVLWSREDDMKHDFYRPAGLNRLEAGLDASGNPVGVKFQLTSQSITQRAFGLPKNTLDPFMVEASVPLYSVPNTAHDVIIHDTGYRVGYLRAVSHTMNCFANESFMDELAHAAGKDPVAYRLGLLGNEPRITNVLKIAAEKAGWGRKLPKGRALGVAIMEGYGTYMAQVAEVSVTEGNAKVHKVWVVSGQGNMVNPEIVRQQLESGIIYGLSGALYTENTLANGRIQQANFNDFTPIRQNQAPVIDVTLVETANKPGGVGEPSTSLIGPAVANAIFAATGKRLRSMPLAKGLKSA